MEWLGKGDLGIGKTWDSLLTYRLQATQSVTLTPLSPRWGQKSMCPQVIVRLVNNVHKVLTVVSGT